MSKNIEHLIKDKVREIAKTDNRAFNDVWKTLILERFLARLSRSSQIDNLIFKGGMLLSKYIPLGRETVDLDFLAVNLSASVDAIRSTIEGILNIPCEDAFTFTDLEVEQLAQPHMNYPGYGVKATAILGGTRTSISIDIGIGDVVEKAEKNIEFLALKTKPLFEASVALQVYPLEYIFAEKLETVIYRGTANSRMKDFFDLWLMLTLESQEIDVHKTKDAIDKTFNNRETIVQLISPIFSANYESMEKNWQAFCRGLGDEAKGKAPDSIKTIIEEIDRWLAKRI